MKMRLVLIGFSMFTLAACAVEREKYADELNLLLNTQTEIDMVELWGSPYSACQIEDQRVLTWTNRRPKCETALTINADQVVVGWQFEGNGCE